MNVEHLEVEEPNAKRSDVERSDNKQPNFEWVYIDWKQVHNIKKTMSEGVHLRFFLSRIITAFYGP